MNFRNEGYFVSGEMIECEDMNWSIFKLYCIIQALSKKTGYCFASNSYLSKIMGSSISTIQKSLQVLVRNEFIKSIVLRDEVTSVVLERRIIPNHNVGLEKSIKQGIKGLDTKPAVMTCYVSAEEHLKEIKERYKVTRVEYQDDIDDVIKDTVQAYIKERELKKGNKKRD